MSHVDWHAVMQHKNADEALKSFYDIIYNVLDECVPKFKAKSKRKQYPSWCSR
ncbi:unnamed protein product, partial [Callosobruchus maculatus]